MPARTVQLAEFTRPVKSPKNHYQFKINKITFETLVSYKPGRITILVGPNNSGKSFALKKLQATINTGRAVSPYHEIAINLPGSMKEFHASYGLHLNVRPEEIRYDRNQLLDELALDYATEASREIDARIDRWLTGEKHVNEISFLEAYGRLFNSRAATEDRITASSTIARSPRGSAVALLHQLYLAGRATERLLSDVTKSVFGLETRLDDSNMNELSIRIGADLQNIPFDAMDARSALGKHSKIEEQGDGLRSFITLTTTLLIGARPILMIDEPEAFLHPAQAYALGKVIAKAEPTSGQLFIASHSGSFLRGLLSTPEGRNDIRVIRFTRHEGRNRQRLLEAETVAKLANEPLLASANFIEGIFYPGVLLFEGNSDRIFFETVGRKLERLTAELYLAGLGYHSVFAMHEAYRALGVPSAALLDFDILTHEDELLSCVKQLTSSKSFHNEVQRSLQAVLENWDGKQDLKRYGRRALNTKGASHAENLARLLSSVGVVLNPEGELESSLTDVGIAYSSDKRTWIDGALQYVVHATPDPTHQPWALFYELDRTLSQVRADLE